MPLFVSRLSELPDYHASRKDLLEKIDNKLLDNSTLLIDGMPGSGKTQLCIEYAHEQLKKAQETNQPLIIAFFNAENADTMQSSYEALAMSLHVYNPDLSKYQLIDAVNKKLHQSPFLFIFDNVVNKDVIQPYLLPESTPNKEGKVLITTRESHSLNTIVNPDLMLSVPNQISEIEARVILSNITKLSDEKGIEEFAKHFNFHPLLLTLHAQKLANLNRQNKVNYADYLQNFLKSDPDSTPDTLEQIIHDKLVSSITIAFENIMTSDPELQNLLLFTSFLSSDAINPSLLHRYLSVDPIFHNSPACQPNKPDITLVNKLKSEKHPALLALSKFFNNDPNKPELKSYSMHRLVQETIQTFFFENYEKDTIQQTIDIFLQTLVSCGEEGIQNEHDYYKKQWLIPHLKAAIDPIKLHAACYRNESLIKLYNMLGKLYKSKGEPDQALIYYHKAEEAATGNKVDQSLIAELADNMGRAYQAKARAKDALNCYLKAEKILQDAKQTNCSRYFKVLNDIGMAYRDLAENPGNRYGLTKEEMQAYTQLSIPYLERAYALVNQTDTHHGNSNNVELSLDCIRYASNLAEGYRMNQRFGLSQTYLKLAIKDALKYKASRGDESDPALSRLLASAYFNLGRLEQDCGNLNQALFSFELAVEEGKAHYANHPLHARHLHALAAAQYQQGLGFLGNTHLGNARTTIEKAVKIITKTHQPGHELYDKIKILDDKIKKLFKFLDTPASVTSFENASRRNSSSFFAAGNSKKDEQRRRSHSAPVRLNARL